MFLYFGTALRGVTVMNGRQKKNLKKEKEISEKDIEEKGHVTQMNCDGTNGTL